MGDVVRFSVSLETELMRQFDALLAARRYTNRSEAVRDLIREALIERQWETGSGETAGVLTLQYEHSSMELAQRLTHMQHDEFPHIISSLHVHLDHDNCLEVLILRGKPAKIHAAADRLISTPGVKHGKLTTTTTGRQLR